MKKGITSNTIRICGVTLCVIGVFAIIGALSGADIGQQIPVSIYIALAICICLIPGLLLIKKSRSMILETSYMSLIHNLIVNGNEMSIVNISTAVKKSEDEVIKLLKKMMRQKMLPGWYINMDAQTIVQEKTIENR